jgi:hypothetical protein
MIAVPAVITAPMIIPAIFLLLLICTSVGYNDIFNIKKTQGFSE